MNQTNAKSCVAIIDDERDMRESVSQWLQLSGFEPLGFEAAETALKTLAPDFPGIVVTDVKMPGMDGMALLRRLQSVDPALPVIVMTGHGDVPMAVEAMRIGAFDFVEKPFEPDRLADLCQRASETRARTLETRALRREMADGAVIMRRFLGACPLVE
nr:sigma-54-dependent Fis family transcriptional regulator [Paracoccaceae bacterium]